MSYIDLTNFVTVSVSSPSAGLASFAVNNIAIFTKELPVNGAITKTNPGIYVSPTDVATDWGSTSEVYAQVVNILSQSPNPLDGGGNIIIYPMGNTDLLKDSISALHPIVFFGGALVAGYDPVDAEYIDAAATAESLRVKLMVSSPLTTATAATTGLFYKISAASSKHGRCFLYIGDTTTVAARKAAAAYLGRAMSVDFTGSSTANTMHGKTLANVTPDTGITQTVLAACEAVGADCYPSVGGGGQYIGKVFSTGFNDYFDNVYNLDWLVFALQVAGANAIMTVGTKIPQTEPGMAILKDAYAQVLQQAVANGFLAPGSWTSPELFGSPQDLKRCVLNAGWYMYSAPVNKQSQADRAARKAPLVQIAVKYAGAIHSSAVVVSVNA